MYLECLGCLKCKGWCPACRATRCSSSPLATSKSTWSCSPSTNHTNRWCLCKYRNKFRVMQHHNNITRFRIHSSLIQQKTQMELPYGKSLNININLVEGSKFLPWYLPNPRCLKCLWCRECSRWCRVCSRWCRACIPWCSSKAYRWWPCNREYNNQLVYLHQGWWCRRTKLEWHNFLSSFHLMSQCFSNSRCQCQWWSNSLHSVCNQSICKIVPRYLTLHKRNQILLVSESRNNLKRRNHQRNKSTRHSHRPHFNQRWQEYIRMLPQYNRKQ